MDGDKLSKPEEKVYNAVCDEALKQAEQKRKEAEVKAEEFRKKAHKYETRYYRLLHQQEQASPRDKKNGRRLEEAIQEIKKLAAIELGKAKPKTGGSNPAVGPFSRKFRVRSGKTYLGFWKKEGKFAVVCRNPKGRAVYVPIPGGGNLLVTNPDCYAEIRPPKPEEIYTDKRQKKPKETK